MAVTRGRWVHPTTHEIFKFLPHNPPQKGDIVLVDGERSKVVRSDVDWDGRKWILRRVKVKRA